MNISKEKSNSCHIVTRGKFSILGLIVIYLFLSFTTVYAQYVVNDWTTPINFSEQPDTYSSVADIICDPYQNLHVFWGERLDQEGVSSSVLFYKNNKQGAWSKPIDLLITSRFEEIHSVVTPNKWIHLVWLNTDNEIIYYRAPLSVAEDIKEWNGPFVLESDATDSNLAIDKDGVLYVLYTTSSSDALNYGIYYIQSKDSGITWSLSKTILEFNTPVESLITSQLAIDGHGRFHVVYTVRSFNYGTYSALGYLRSTDGGSHWDSPLTLPEAETSPGVAKIAVFTFGENEIHLTYDVPERVHQWSYNGGVTWSQPIQIVNGVELGAAFGGYNVLVKDETGIVHVVFAESRGVFHATWAGIAWSTAELIDAPVFDPHGQTITLCQGNRLTVLYSGNDITSEIWQSEKTLNIRRIAQQLIPNAVSTPTLPPTSVENAIISTTPQPTEIFVNPPDLQQNESSLLVVIYPIIFVMLLILTTLIIKVMHR